MPPTSTAEGSPTVSITSMSSKSRFIGTVRMVDPTALHAADPPASRPQWACKPGSRDVLGLVAGRFGRWRRARAGAGARRDVVTMERVAHDLREDGGGDRAAED